MVQRVQCDLSTAIYYYGDPDLVREKIREGPLGQTTEYDYYAGGPLYQVTDPNDAVTTYEYDDISRVSRITDGQGHYRTAAYNSFSQTIFEKRYDSAETALQQVRSEYNALGNLTRRAIMADAGTLITTAVDTTVDMVTDYIYDDSQDDYPGLLTSQTVYYGGSPASPAITSYTYDDFGRRATTTDPLGNITALTYNDAGQITRRRQTYDNPLLGGGDIVLTTDFEYESHGRMTSQIEKPDPCTPSTWLTTEYVSDGLDHQLKITNPKDSDTTFAYDALGRLTQKIADAGTGTLNQATEYTYDRLGRQTAIVGYTDNTDDQTKQTTTYTYDKLGRVTCITYPDGESLRYAYNPAGKVTSRIDQRDQKTLYSYDMLGHLLTKRCFGLAGYYTCDPNDPNDPSCEPERIGEPLYAVDPNLTETFTYDGLSRMLSVQKTVNASNVSDSDFTYNDLGLKTAETTTLFAASQVTISYDYDQAGYLTAITYPDGNSLVVTPDPLGRIDTLALDGTTVATYEYLGPRVLQRNYPVPDVTYDISYNNLAQATRHRSHIDSTDIANFPYSFDDNGNIAWQQYDHRSGDPCTAFTYDGLDRLTRADYGIQSENEQFTLDDLGNRTNVNLRSGADETYVVDETTNRYNTVGGNNLDYDACGNMTLDPNDYEYQYDFENRMVKITKNETAIAEFTYDPLGRRIEQYDAVADETIRYYYDGWHVLAEFDDTETQLRDYVYGNYLDEVLCKTENGDTLYYVHDHLYSPVALVDAEGTVVERYEYDAYGKRYVFDSSFNPRSNTLYDNFVAFTGQQLYILDNGNLSGMHYNARDYTPPRGRFLQHDPHGMISEGIFGIGFETITQFDDGMNLYEYAKSNPVNLTDPFGLSTLCGTLRMKCCKNNVSWSVYGDSKRAKFILGGKEGCVTLLLPKAIFCTGSCKDIKLWRSAGNPNVKILDHEACHACAYEDGWLLGYTWSWIPGDLTGYCDKHPISSTPGW